MESTTFSFLFIFLSRRSLHNGNRRVFLFAIILFVNRKTRETEEVEKMASCPGILQRVFRK